MGNTFEFRSLIRPRVKVCRHCGALFKAMSAARTTCYRPACEAWARAKRNEQVKANVKRYRARLKLIKKGTR